MRELNLELPPSGRPSYLRIAEALRTAIRDRQIEAGEFLPSSRQLSDRLGVHRHTIMAAMEELIAEGWLVAQPKQGYCVSETLPSRFYEPLTEGKRKRAYPIPEFRLVRRGGLDEGSAWQQRESFPYNFQSGLADLRLFPRDEFRGCINDALKGKRLDVLHYADPAGHPALLRELSSYLRRMRAISDREILVTHGSQEGIFLAAQLLVAPGDAVAVERLGYPPAWEAMTAAGAKLVPLEVDAEGVVPESLEKAVARQPLRLIYVTPLHQYPTTVTMPIARRLRIYDIAARHGIPILEDDYDHEFHYRSQPLAPLAANDPAQIVIYVSTFSKVLFPSARIGFLAVPKRLAPAAIGYRRIVTRQNNSLLQDALARWMHAGGFERHLRKMRKVYQERRDALASAIESGKARGHALDYQLPDGGMAIWLDIGRDSGPVAERAAKAGVLVTAGERYGLRSAPSPNLRLGFANQSPKEIQEGVRRLLDAL